MSASIVRVKRFERIKKNKNIIIFISFFVFIALFYYYLLNHSKPIKDFIAVINKNEKIVEYFGPNITKKGIFGGISIEKFRTLLGNKKAREIEIDIMLQGDKKSGYISAALGKVNNTDALLYFEVYELNRESNKIVDLKISFSKKLAKKLDFYDHTFDLQKTIKLMLSVNAEEHGVAFSREHNKNEIILMIDVDATGNKIYHIYHDEYKTNYNYASTKSLDEVKKVWQCYISGSDEFKTYLNWVEVSK